MANNDHVAIANLLGVDNLSHFDSVEWKDIPDTNAGDYTNPINFTTTAWLNNWMHHHVGYNNMPLTLIATGTTAHFAAEGLITKDANGNMTGLGANPINMGLKNGIYSLVNTLKVDINDAPIENTVSGHIYSNIKANTQWSKDYADSIALLYNFSRDTIPKHTADNKGFIERCSLTNFKRTVVQEGQNESNNAYTVAGAGDDKLITVTDKFYANVPLALISNFFEALNMPLRNAEIKLSMTINGLDKGSGNTTEFNPIACDAKLIAAMRGGSKSVQMSIGGLRSNCRFYVPEVKLSPEDVTLLDAELSRVHTDSEGKALLNKDGTPQIGAFRTFKWNNIKVVQNKQPVVGTSEDLSLVISTATRRPIKVWSFFSPLSQGGTLDGNANAAMPSLNTSLMKYQGVPYPSMTAKGVRIADDDIEAARGGVGLKEANLVVDSNDLYRKNISEPYEFYQLFKEQTPAANDDKQSGALISYKDFTENYQYYVFDLTRTNYVMTDKSISLEFRAKKVNPNLPTELYHVIESEAVTQLNLSNTNIRITHVGSI